MSLSATTQKLVEEKTGLPVHVEPDSSLPATQLAKVVVARGSPERGRQPIDSAEEAELLETNKTAVRWIFYSQNL